MTTSMRFVFGCGGTGGHIFPGIALAQELQRRGKEVLFIGNQAGMESQLIEVEGFKFSGIHVQKLYRKVSLSNLMFPVLLVSSIFASAKIMRQFGPQGVICTGGFVAGPVAIAALLLRIPLFFHESNSYPGITTRFLARFTKITFTSFVGTSKFLKKAHFEQLGIPIPERKKALQEIDLGKTGLDANKPIILVTGGSQGSQAINSAIDSAVPRLLESGFQLIWQTGKTGYSNYHTKYLDQQGVYIFDFSPLLADYYGIAKVAVTRAGALTIAELEANHLPAVMIPLPSAAENHQYYNALEQQKRGLALLLKQHELDPKSLLDAINLIMKNYQGYKTRLALPPNTAAKDVNDSILGFLSKEKTDVR